MRTILTLIFMTGCASSFDTGCPAVHQAISMLQSTRAGSATDVVSMVSGEESFTLIGAELGATAADLTVDWTGDSPQWAESQGEESTTCRDSIVIPAEVALVTANGLFDETWLADVRSSAPGVATMSHSISADNLGGSWMPPDSGLQDVQLRFEITWNEEGGAGQIIATGTPADGGPDVSWEVAVWPG